MVIIVCGAAPSYRAFGPKSSHLISWQLIMQALFSRGRNDVLSS